MGPPVTKVPHFRHNVSPTSRLFGNVRVIPTQLRPSAMLRTVYSLYVRTFLHCGAPLQPYCNIHTNFRTHLSSGTWKWRLEINGTKSSHITFTLRRGHCPPVYINQSQRILCITRTVEHNYILPNSTVRIQLHVSVLYVGHLQVEI